MARRLALVTGASTGIGRATAVHLGGLGFEVLAGVRNLDDAPPGTQPVILDVTKADDVAAAAARVGPTLHALVNNAGIAVNGPIEWVEVDDWRRQFEVNLIGQVAVTKALLPALLQARGRIVNMSSIAGKVAWPMISPYTASKFALEAVTDALRRELGPHGVKVVSIEPGGVSTPVWEKSSQAADELLAAMPADIRQRHAQIITGVRRTGERLARDGKPPEAVAEVVGHALTARRPRTRYVIGLEARMQVVLSRLLPDRAVDALIRRVLTSGGRSDARG